MATNRGTKGKTRGGKRRMYKIKGHLSARKCYQQHCHNLLASGMGPTAAGNWTEFKNFPTKIEEVYVAQFAR